MHPKSSKWAGIPQITTKCAFHYAIPNQQNERAYHKSRQNVLSTMPSLKPFGHKMAELLKMSILKPSGSHLGTRCKNCLKWGFWDHLGAMWPPGARIIQNEPSDTTWKPFGHQVAELLKMSFLKPPGSELATKVAELLKMRLLKPSGGHLATRC